MRQVVAKRLRRVSQELGLNYKGMKRRWNSVPRNIRNLEQFETQIRLISDAWDRAKKK